MPDHGYLELSAITWTLQKIPTADFHTMPTGESEAGLIEHFAENPVHWVTVWPPQVGRQWEDHGTWLRTSLLIDRHRPDPAGLQVLEGRARVGILRGFLREQLHVAPEHQAWAGFVRARRVWLRTLRGTKVFSEPARLHRIPGRPAATWANQRRPSPPWTSSLPPRTRPSTTSESLSRKLVESGDARIHRGEEPADAERLETHR
ncbi:hypothetical protein [Streptomyces sp. NPDC016845]|uniref:hypothetical protein n=1 Tax=Streptomyces sp. NPDC016845 TaxID=3364972 RepID=UPI003789B3CA